MNDFNQKFDNLCSENKLIGSNIVVCDKDNVLEKCCYGYQDLDSKLPSSLNTIYRIASISKTVGAIALMQLEEKGLIDLDEDISKYLGFKVCNPNFPNDIITVKMLTMQTSSIQDGYDDGNPLYDDIRKGYNGINGTYLDVSLKTLLTDTKSEYYTDLTFGNYKPGTRFCYSNFGCGIMACIIEMVSGELYVDYMENHIFKPLGLNASFKASRILGKENIATMYYKTSSGLHSVVKERFTESKLPVFPLGNNYRGPAGGLFISMNDLSVIMRMFMNYGTYNGIEILKRETVEKMYQMTWCGLPNDNYRAKGLQMKIIRDVDSFTLRGHTGGAYGVRSYMFFNLRQGLGACFITNGIDACDDSAYCNNVFYGTQKEWIEKYGKELKTDVVITKDEIVLPERKIIHKDLFINKDNPYILGKAFADAIDQVPVYDEDKMAFTITVNNHEHIINDVIVYKDELYINLENSLKELKINYKKENDKYLLTL